MENKIVHNGQECKIVHIDTDDFAHNLVKAYIHTLFDQVEKENGIRNNFLTYNGELLISLAQALAVILTGMEDTSISDNDNNKTKDEIIKLLNKFYRYKDNEDKNRRESGETVE